MLKRHATGYELARADRNAEIAARSRITEDLRQQRLKRDAEALAAAPVSTGRKSKSAVK